MFSSSTLKKHWVREVSASGNVLPSGIGTKKLEIRRCIRDVIGSDIVVVDFIKVGRKTTGSIPECIHGIFH
jgi:hypothetical protein